MNQFKELEMNIDKIPDNATLSQILGKPNNVQTLNEAVASYGFEEALEKFKKNAYLNDKVVMELEIAKNRMVKIEESFRSLVVILAGRLMKLSTLENKYTLFLEGKFES